MATPKDRKDARAASNAARDATRAAKNARDTANEARKSQTELRRRYTEVRNKAAEVAARQADERARSKEWTATQDDVRKIARAAGRGGAAFVVVGPHAGRVSRVLYQVVKRPDPDALGQAVKDVNHELQKAIAHERTHQEKRET
jgi:hypothetical protein